MQKPTLNDRHSRVYQIVFWIASAAVFAACAWRLWNIRLLYADIMLRSQIDLGISSISDARGWPVSDMELTAVYPDRFRFLHRVHRKGRDETTCLDAVFESDAVPPCKN